MKRSDRRRHARTSALMANWAIDHQCLDISVEVNGHTAPVDVVIELDRKSRQITSWQIVPHPSDAPTAPHNENSG